MPGVEDLAVNGLSIVAALGHSQLRRKDSCGLNTYKVMSVPKRMRSPGC